jgi:HEAT repeat protein
VAPIVRESLSSPCALRATTVLLALTLPLAACGSTQEQPEPVVTQDLSLGPDTTTVLSVQAPDDIGAVLTEIDRNIRAWSKYKLEALTPDDHRIRRKLEEDIRVRTMRRFDEIVAQLETGPPVNRPVAAAALGFSEDPRALGPLLAALSDRDDHVVSNALLGLGQLSRPETSLVEICYILRTHPSPNVRNNAAYAMLSIVGSGGSDECVAKSCMRALTDDEPGVRAQAARLLGHVGGPEAIDEVGFLLEDDQALVVTAAAAALRELGERDMYQKGRAARKLADALDRVPRTTRDALIAELIVLAGGNAGGRESDAWREWAYRLP